jgi:hypothetical protein
MNQLAKSKKEKEEANHRIMLGISNAKVLIILLGKYRISLTINYI